MTISFPLLLDGAMGTQLYKHGYQPGVCPEQWCLDHPEAVLSIQRSYVNAGSQVLYAPTFGANSTVLERNGIFNQVEAFNVKLVQLSREASGGKALVAGDISSVGAMLYPIGDSSFEDIYQVYLEQAQALEKAGVDLFVIETMTNLAEARAALLAVKSVSSKPVFVTFSCSEKDRTMTGTDVLAALSVMQGMGADAFGLNCSVGPEEIAAQIRRIAPYASVPLIAKPNAGLPRTAVGGTFYDVPSDKFASFIPELADAGVQIFGGCCGTDAGYVSAIADALSTVPVKKVSHPVPAGLPSATERDFFLLPEDAAIAEVFACDEELEDNLSDTAPGELIGVKIESLEDLAVFSDCQYAVSNPLCILCEDAQLLEKALCCYQGRALYEGSLPDSVLLPLAQKYGLIF